MELDRLTLLPQRMKLDLLSLILPTDRGARPTAACTRPPPRAPWSAALPAYAPKLNNPLLTLPTPLPVLTPASTDRPYVQPVLTYCTLFSTGLACIRTSTVTDLVLRPALSWSGADLGVGAGGRQKGALACDAWAGRAASVRHPPPPPQHRARRWPTERPGTHLPRRYPAFCTVDMELVRGVRY